MKTSTVQRSIRISIESYKAIKSKLLSNFGINANDTDIKLTKSASIYIPSRVISKYDDTDVLIKDIKEKSKEIITSIRKPYILKMDGRHSSNNHWNVISK